MRNRASEKTDSSQRPKTCTGITAESCEEINVSRYLSPLHLLLPTLCFGQTWSQKEFVYCTEPPVQWTTWPYGLAPMCQHELPCHLTLLLYKSGQIPGDEESLGRTHGPINRSHSQSRHGAPRDLQTIGSPSSRSPIQPGVQPQAPECQGRTGVCGRGGGASRSWAHTSLLRFLIRPLTLALKWGARKSAPHPHMHLLQHVFHHPRLSKRWRERRNNQCQECVVSYRRGTKCTCGLHEDQV